MYYQHFGLDRPPFKITPDTDFFFTGGNRGAILEALLYAVTEGEGIVKVTGEVGSGKTMLCRMLQSRLPPTVEQVYLANPNVLPEDILHAIAFELGLPVAREASRIELVHALQDHLVRCHAEGRQVVVFVEESQSMPLATLEEIRLLSNLETQHHKLLQIVLFGQPELDAILGQPAIRQLRDRIAHSFSLQPLRAEEVREYLAFRLRAAGYRGPDLFAPKLVRHIADATGGLSRRVNLVADKALLAAFADNTHTVKLSHVQAAVRESEFSPRITPLWPRWVGSAALLAAGAAIGVAGYWWLGSTRSSLMAPPTAAVPAAAPAAGHPSLASVPAATPGETKPQLLAANPPAKGTAPSALPVSEMDTRSSPPPSLEVPQAHAGTAAMASARMAATDRWLARATERAYTIQLTLAANNPEELTRYLDRIGQFIESEHVFVYPTRLNDKPYLGVAYGSFPTRQAAQAAIKALPETVRSDRPFVRSASAIRRESQRSL